MVRIGGSRPIPYNNGYVLAHQKEFKYDVLDKKLNKIAQYTRPFTRVKRDIEAMMGRMQIQLDGDMPKETRARMMSQMKNQMITQMGEYEDDIQGVLGAKSEDLFIETATGNEAFLAFDVVRNNELYTQHHMEFDDEIRQSKIEHGKLIVSFRNKQDGPYIKIFDINVN